MFITLLLVTFLIALGVSALVAHLFKGPIAGIVQRIIAEEISSAWVRYMRFAIYVVGISKGVRVWELERYITPRPLAQPGLREGGSGEAFALALTTERWILEVYRTIIETLQGIAWMLLVFFVFALLAYVAVRLLEARKSGE